MKVYALLLVWILCCLPATAQGVKFESKALSERLRFYLIDDEAGLSNNTINSIVQDSSGFIWIGTIEGLCRYDGSSFVKYRKDIEDSTSLLNNYVQSLYVDKSGKIWISTDEGLNVYNVAEETFLAYTNKTGLLGNNVNSIIPGPGGSVIIGIYRGGIQILHPNGTLEDLFHDTNNINSLSSDEISSLAMQGDSVLWVGTYNGGLNKIRWKDRKVKRIPYGRSETFSSATINDIYPDQNANIWIGSKAGFHVITADSDTLFATASLSSGEGLSDSDVLCFMEDDMERMWIGTRNGGLNILNIRNFLQNKKSLKFDWFLPREDGESVFNRTISTIMKDNAGNMWLGTSTGINFVNPRGEKIKLINRNAVSKETLAHNRIGALERGANGKLWIGTDGGGLNLFDPLTGNFKHFFNDPEDQSTISNNYVISLKKDSRDWLWIGTYRGGINRMDPKTGSCAHYLQGSVSDGSDVRSIIEDSNNKIWAGTNQGGLYGYDEQEDVFVHIAKSGSLDIRDILEDKSGGLWLATFGSGICYYNPEKDSLRTFNTDNTLDLPSNIIFTLVQSSENEIWAGTRYGGLVNFKFESGRVTVYSEKNGLSNNTVNSLILEDSQNLWMGTLNGIAHFDLTTKKITGLTSHDGITQGEFNIGAAIIAHDGYVYFGGNKGITVFNPKEIKKIESSPPVILTGLKIFNKPIPVTPNDKTGILNKAISHQQEIVLSYDQTLFSIDFTVLNYPFSEKVNYSYILENYNDYWVESGNVGTANFSNVPPGTYTFKVKASVAPGGGSETFTSLNVTITPPFWKTWPAYALYCILLGLIIYGTLRYYSERIKLRNLWVFEKKQRQLEHDLNEERLRFFTSFSHELKTPLTLILAPVEDLIGKLKVKEYKESLELVHKNARYLLQLINKLLEFRKSEVGLNQLTLGEYDFNLLLKNWVDNYQLLASRKKITLTYRSAPGEVKIWLDIEKIQIIVYNLLTNAFKFTPKHGTIEVSLFANQTHVFIQVRDSGVGISSAELTSIFTWYYKAQNFKKANGTGIGLALSKRLAELHHGDIEVESEVNKGSVFTVFLPFEQELPKSLQPASGTDFVDQQYEEHLINLPCPDAEIEAKEYVEKMIHLNEKENKEVLLLIDDNPDILQYLNNILKEDYHIINANDGQKGLENAYKYVPDLIISDIMMPVTSGIDLCKTLKQNPATTHIPIILLSAKDTLDSVKEGFEEGADHYITKPFNSQLLLAKIKSLLNTRKQLRNYFNAKNREIIVEEEANSPLFHREKKFLEKLETIILKHIDSNETNVEAIAHAMGMSRTSLYRKIKALTGQNITEYIRSIKVKKAARLISENGFNISQAAYEVGFGSVKYFRKLFKEQYGKLPSDLNKEIEKQA